MLSIPFFSAISNILLVYIAIVLLMDSFKSKEKGNKVLRNTNVYLIVYLLSFGVLVFLNFFVHSDISSYSKESFFLIYPIIFVAGRKYIDIRDVFIYFLIGVFSSIIILIVFGIYSGTILEFPNTKFSRELLDISHVYYGVLIGCSLIILYTQYFKEKKIIVLGFCIFGIGLLLYIGARMSLLASVFIASVFFIDLLKNYKLKVLVFFILIGIIGVLSSHPRIKSGTERIVLLKTAIEQNDETYLKKNSWRNMNMRFFVLKHSLEEIPEHPWFGVGLSNVKDELYDISMNRNLCYTKKINPHNQYAHYLYALGLPLGAYFIVFYLLIMIFSFKRNKSLFLIMSFLSFCMMTESLLVREKGLQIILPIILSLNFKYENNFCE
jgi:hypothetical protein